MNRDNLRKLADYLITGRVEYEFDMKWYCVSAYRDHEYSPAKHDCGAIACALGHGPAAGIEPSADCYSWQSYSRNQFDLAHYSDEWDWAFGPGWSYLDNTPQGAAKRIYWLLEHGLPKNWAEQQSGEEPLCYV
ncbi:MULTISPECIES: hypothetical protein [unclassified Beijerinckia]|uniref:hypothetical protein n=1 Tax=unclassified Beijerinckia TaxID=2638183 RepID=UPI00089A8BA0|nr:MULTISPECIES: hypothetical protein [unclassified Beijerinckia]MDH7796399.1 hypothetical protein [Beijerinckia sp. GAS462]SEC43473.1 hypothetical protein SAMN05443249_2681 [Beijerinckia sp. 28-YEA-48]